MKYIVVDLEMNPIGKEYEAQRQFCKDEVIEIGAVVLDEKYQEIGSFVTFVKPQMNTVITNYITRLTGIKTAQVESAPSFVEALQMFLKWCDLIQDDVVVLQWSVNDRTQLMREMALKGIQLAPEQAKFFGEWKDFQQEFGELLGLDQLISLKSALYYADADFAGRQHDALDDARNTAFLVKTVHTPELREKALGRVISVLKPETIGSSLGDMFDFSKMCLGA